MMGIGLSSDRCLPLAFPASLYNPSPLPVRLAVGNMSDSRWGVAFLQDGPHCCAEAHVWAGGLGRNPVCSIDGKVWMTTTVTFSAAVEVGPDHVLHCISLLERCQGCAKAAPGVILQDFLLLIREAVVIGAYGAGQFGPGKHGRGSSLEVTCTNLAQARHRRLL